jgi:hypothetical protein
LLYRKEITLLFPPEPITLNIRSGWREMVNPMSLLNPHWTAWRGSFRQVNFGFGIFLPERHSH